MAQLVQRRVRVGVLRRELAPYGQHHPVFGLVVVGPVPGAVVDPDAAVLHHRLDPLVALPRRSGAVERAQLQALGLLDVEDVLDLRQRAVALLPRVGRPALAVEHRLAALVANLHAAVELDVHDRRALLTLADVPAGLLDLAVAAPARVRVAAVQPLHRQVHGVAAAVVPAAGEVVRQDPLAGLPRLLPGRGPFLERLDDALGKLLVVLVLPVLPLGHLSGPRCRLPRPRGRRPTLPAPRPTGPRSAARR